VLAPEQLHVHCREYFGQELIIGGLRKVAEALAPALAHVGEPELLWKANGDPPRLGISAQHGVDDLWVIGMPLPSLASAYSPENKGVVRNSQRVPHGVAVHYRRRRLERREGNVADPIANHIARRLFQPAPQPIESKHPYAASPGERKDAAVLRRPAEYWRGHQQRRVWPGPIGETADKPLVIFRSMHVNDVGGELARGLGERLQLRPRQEAMPRTVGLKAGSGFFGKKQNLVSSANHGLGQHAACFLYAAQTEIRNYLDDPHKLKVAVVQGIF